MVVVGSPGTVQRFGRYARYASTLVIAIGAIACAGWIAGVPLLPQFDPRLPAMKMNTSLALVAGGIVLACSIRGPAAWPVRALAVATTSLAAATLLQYLAGIDLGIDQLLRRDPASVGIPGRMSPATAVCLILFGAALIWLQARWAEWLTLAGFLIAHLALLGHLYGVPDLYATGANVSVALPTAIALVVLALGIILARPQRGLMRVVSSDSPGGVLARRLLPAAVVLPAVLALLRQWGEAAGLYGTGFGRALFVASTSTLFAALIWGVAAALTHADRQRRAAEDDIRASEARKTAILADQVRSSERLHVLAQVSRVFAGVATSSATLLDQIARAIADIIGDGCMVTLLDDDGDRMFNAANAHRDPGLEHDYQTYLAGTSVSLSSSNAISAVVARTGQPRRADVSPDAMVARSDEALQAMVARLNIHSYAAVAIRVRGAIIGTLSCVRSTPDHGYTDDDLTLLQDVADRAGLAIESARLYEQLEARVRERTRDLETANKELEAFSYSVAHDLRTPLRGIAGFSRALIDEHAAALPPTGIDYLGRIEAGARRMGHLIDDLLALARVSRAEVHRRRIDLSEMARAVIHRLQVAQPGRDVEIVIEDGLVAQADPRLLDVVLTNLLGNAWKFTGNRTGARIELAARAGSPTTYVVRDNGAGFEAKYANKLFGVFERLHTAHEFEGTGIGLAIAYRIIDRHGGRIWAEGAVDHGATFFFTLEAQPRDGHARETRSPPRGDAPSQGAAP